MTVMLVRFAPDTLDWYRYVASDNVIRVGLEGWLVQTIYL